MSIQDRRGLTQGGSAATDADLLASMHAIERFILAYDGDNLFHDIDVNFPGASYRAFFLAIGRARAAQWLRGGRHRMSESE
jgi:hypothetical protein